ncbi:MAG TPA: ribonuclease III [Dokdonella sp.]|uniref:ribonuclease III n=1 Tax=Dokdonella sp. TaxID=2291710 RepID=UPI002D80E837|nr:ribonuclease III [Dokdonella sp.]HET9032521.1 ribonuclease III [Dokdonella sp.]
MEVSHQILGHCFVDKSLLEQALTHRSAGRRNNERLEFLGDALLNLIVAEYVYEQYPRASEGDMTRARASLVNGSTLAELAREAQIGDHLVLGPGELKTGGFRRDSILADTFEALVAAIYLDVGWERCRTLVRQVFAERVMAVDGKVSKDSKTLLQELLQANALPLPVYELLGTRGDDHDKEFDVICQIESLELSRSGSGSSRRAAEQAAAEGLLDQARASIAAQKKNRKS